MRRDRKKQKNHLRRVRKKLASRKKRPASFIRQFDRMKYALKSYSDSMQMCVVAVQELLRYPIYTGLDTTEKKVTSLPGRSAGISTKGIKAQPWPYKSEIYLVEYNDVEKQEIHKGVVKLKEGAHFTVIDPEAAQNDTTHES